MRKLGPMGRAQIGDAVLMALVVLYALALLGGFAAAGFWIGSRVDGRLGAGIGVAIGVWFGIGFIRPSHTGMFSKSRAPRAAKVAPLWQRWLSQSGNWRSIISNDLMLRALVELVQPGRLLFNPPDRMRLGETERVEVRLTRSLGLDEELLEGLGGPPEPIVEEIATASRMAVTLRGDGFKITGHSEEEQAVTQDDITRWEFDIRAVKRGQQRLFMSVSLRLPVRGQPLVYRSIPVRTVTIYVHVGVPALVGQFVASYWQWLIGTAVAIAAVVVVVFVH